MLPDQRPKAYAVLVGTVLTLLLLQLVPPILGLSPPVQPAAALSTQRDSTACAAMGPSWTSCDAAFASDDRYAYGNGTTVGLPGLNIAFVVGNPAVPDANSDVPVRNHMVNVLGHTVTYVDDNNMSWNTSIYDAVVISDSVGSANTAWLKNEAVGIVTLEGATWDEFELGTAGSSGGGADDEVDVVDNSHYITEVYATGRLLVTTTTTNLGEIRGWANDVNDLAHYWSNPGRSKLLAVEQGGVLQGGVNTAAERRVYYGARHFANLNADGRLLYNRSLDWASSNNLTSAPGVNDTAWQGFGFALDPSDVVTRVEVGVEWWRNNTVPALEARVSWDGGTSWSPVLTATNKSSDDNTVEWLDFTFATAWDTSAVNDANLRVRLGTSGSGARLDYVTVRVNHNVSPSLANLRLEDGLGQSRAGGSLDVDVPYTFAFNVTDPDGWSDIATDGGVFLRLWYDGNVTPELLFGQQVEGPDRRIVLRFADTSDPATAALDEWAIAEGLGTYNASASSQSAILAGPTIIGYEFRLALTLGGQVRRALEPVDETPGSYNDRGSWNGELEVDDGFHVVRLQAAATGAHLEFGVRGALFQPVLIIDAQEAERGDEVRATLYYNNTGAGSAVLAWANWSFGGHYELISLSPSAPFTPRPEGPAVMLTDIAPGFHALVLQLRVIRGLADGQAMELEVTWLALDGLGNPLPQVVLSVAVTLWAPALEVTLDPVPSPVEASATFPLNVTIRNPGRAPGTGWLNLTLPAGVEYIGDDGTFFVTRTGDAVSWRIPTVPEGATILLRVSLRSSGAVGLETVRANLDYTDGRGSPTQSVLSSAVTIQLLGAPPVFPVWLWWVIGGAAGAAVFLFYFLRFRLSKALRIEEVFVVHRDGVLLSHRSKTLTPDKDQDILVALFKTVQVFVKNAFSQHTEAPLRGFQLGDLNVLIEHAPHHYVAVVFRGEDDGALARGLARLSRRIEEEFGETLKKWRGDMMQVRGIRKLIPTLWGDKNVQDVPAAEEDEEEDGFSLVEFLQFWKR